jgi:hypothetical protein
MTRCAESRSQMPALSASINSTDWSVPQGIAAKVDDSSCFYGRYCGGPSCAGTSSAGTDAPRDMLDEVRNCQS